MDKCTICHTPATVQTEGIRLQTHSISCEICGRYATDTWAESVLPTSSYDRGAIRGWIYEQNKIGVRAQITRDSVDRVLRLTKPSLMDRAERLLLAMVDVGGVPPKEVRLQVEHLLLERASYSDQKSEVYFLAQLLDQKGLLELAPRPVRTDSPDLAAATLRVSVEGCVRAEELQAKRSTSVQGFIAVRFNEEMKKASSDGLEPAVHNSGYRPFRVDHEEHADRIDDHIVAGIRRSRFLVADLTWHRNSVYWEAGFAWGLNLPVFLTCRKKDMKKTAFDIRQYNCIDWETVEELRTRLAARIEATLGRGPL